MRLDGIRIDGGAVRHLSAENIKDADRRVRQVPDVNQAAGRVEVAPDRRETGELEIRAAEGQRQSVGDVSAAGGNSDGAVTVALGLRQFVAFGSGALRVSRNGCSHDFLLLR